MDVEHPYSFPEQGRFSSSAATQSTTISYICMFSSLCEFGDARHAPLDFEVCCVMASVHYRVFVYYHLAETFVFCFVLFDHMLVLLFAANHLL